MYKRVDLSGFLLANLFREAYKQFQRDSKIALILNIVSIAVNIRIVNILILLMKNTLKKCLTEKSLKK